MQFPNAFTWYPVNVTDDNLLILLSQFTSSAIIACRIINDLSPLSHLIIKIEKQKLHPHCYRWVMTSSITIIIVGFWHSLPHCGYPQKFALRHRHGTVNNIILSSVHDLQLKTWQRFRFNTSCWCCCSSAVTGWFCLNNNNNIALYFLLTASTHSLPLVQLGVVVVRKLVWSRIPCYPLSTWPTGPGQPEESV